jgi:hypothetical protein
MLSSKLFSIHRSQYMVTQFLNLIVLLRYRFSVICCKLVTSDNVEILCYRRECSPRSKHQNVSYFFSSTSTKESLHYSTPFNNQALIVMTEQSDYTVSSQYSWLHETYYQLRVLHDLLRDISSVVDMYDILIFSDITTTRITSIGACVCISAFCILYPYVLVVIIPGHMKSLHLFWLACEHH